MADKYFLLEVTDNGYVELCAPGLHQRVAFNYMNALKEGKKVLFLKCLESSL